MERLTTLAIIGFCGVFVGDSVTTTPTAEACGVKLVVKANKKPRQKLRAKARTRVIASSGARVAKRKRVNRKSDDTNRVRVASGGNRQARRGANPTPRPVTGKARTRTITNDGASTNTASNPKPAANPKPAKPRVKKTEEPVVARVETKTAEPKPKERVVRKRPAPSNATPISIEIYFGYNNFGVDADARSALADAVQWLRDNPRGRLDVFGHTDSAGPNAYNWRLSARRAGAVRRYLSKEAGVPANRLSVYPRGERDLAYPEDSPKNRRVVVKTR